MNTLRSPLWVFLGNRVIPHREITPAVPFPLVIVITSTASLTLYI